MFAFFFALYSSKNFLLTHFIIADMNIGLQLLKIQFPMITYLLGFTWSMGRRHRTAGTAIVAQPSSAMTTAMWLGRLSP